MSRSLYGKIENIAAKAVLSVFLIAVPICALAQTWTILGPSPTPSPTPAPTATPSWIDPIIVDNPEAVFVGDWLTGSGSLDKYGSDYRFTHAGDGSGQATFRPTLPVAGQYEVFELHPEGTNRTGNAEILLFDGAATHSHTINQKTNGGTWISLGVYTLPAGTDVYTRVTDNFSDGDVVMADAFKFEYQNTAPSPTPSPTATPTPTFTGTLAPFGDYVQEVIDELEYRKEHDTAGYLLGDKWGVYTGVTETLWYQNASYMWNETDPGEWVDFGGWQAQPYGKSYCSGLTLEIFHRAMKKRDADMGIAEEYENWNGVGTKGIFIIKKLWNVITIRYSDTGQIVTTQPCPAVALEMSGLGRVITLGDESKFEDVQKYDFCDISRTTSSGHSVIFINWVRDPGDNRIIGLRYYSTQTSTNGQGYNVEYFSDEGGSVSKRWFRAGRVYDNPANWTANTIREAGYSN